jgi:hypothetical protein
LLRKVMLAFVTTTLAPAGAGMQITTGLVVLLVALVLHARFHPYSNPVINALESFALVTAAMTLVGGVYVVMESAKEAGTATGIVAPVASIMIAIVNVAFLLLAVALWSKAVRALLLRLYFRMMGALLNVSGNDGDDVADLVRKQSEIMVRRAMRKNSISVTRGPSLLSDSAIHSAAVASALPSAGSTPRSSLTTTSTTPTATATASLSDRLAAALALAAAEAEQERKREDGEEEEEEGGEDGRGASAAVDGAGEVHPRRSVLDSSSSGSFRSRTERRNSALRRATDTRRVPDTAFADSDLGDVGAWVADIA